MTDLVLRRIVATGARWASSFGSPEIDETMRPSPVVGAWCGARSCLITKARERKPRGRERKLTRSLSSNATREKSGLNKMESPTTASVGDYYLSCRLCDQGARILRKIQACSKTCWRRKSSLARVSALFIVGCFRLGLALHFELVTIGDCGPDGC